MKKVVMLTWLGILCLIPSFSWASVETVRVNSAVAPYQGYYNGDRNFPLIDAGNEVAIYLDRSSAVKSRDDRDVLAFAFNVIRVSYAQPEPKIISYETWWYVENIVKYGDFSIKKSTDNTWYTFNPYREKSESYFNREARLGFLLGREIVRGGGFSLYASQSYIYDAE